MIVIISECYEFAKQVTITTMKQTITCGFGLLYFPVTFFSEPF